INLFLGRIAADGTIESGTLRLPLRVRTGGREITIGIRPDALNIAHSSNPGWRGMIARVENTGPDRFVHISLAESGRSAVVRTDPYSKPVAAVGSEIVLQPDLRRALLFDQTGARVVGMTEIHRVPAFA